MDRHVLAFAWAFLAMNSVTEPTVTRVFQIKRRHFLPHAKDILGALPCSSHHDEPLLTEDSLPEGMIHDA